MKTLITLVTILAATTVSAKTMTAMNYVEKSAYAIQRLTQQNKINALFLTDTSQESVAVRADGATLELRAIAGTGQLDNVLIFEFDSSGNLSSYKEVVDSRNSASPIFSNLNAATILDLGAEAVVDHLGESADLPVVASAARGVTINKDGGGYKFAISIADGRTYTIQMDEQGNIVGQGF